MTVRGLEPGKNSVGSAILDSRQHMWPLFSARVPMRSGVGCLTSALGPQGTFPLEAVSPSVPRLVRWFLFLSASM